MGTIIEGIKFYTIPETGLEITLLKIKNLEH